MISQKLKNAYENLDSDNKMNKLNYELLVIEALLKKIAYHHNMTPDFKFKNYAIDSNMKPEEFLEFIYDDIFEIEKQLLLLTDKINQEKNNQM